MNNVVLFDRITIAGGKRNIESNLGGDAICNNDLLVLLDLLDLILR